MLLTIWLGLDFLTHFQQTPKGTRIHEKLLANNASWRRGLDDDFMEPLGSIDCHLMKVSE